MDGDRTSLQNLRRQVEAVNGIHLTGAPRTLLLDAPALLSSGGGVQAPLAAKLDVLARHEGMQVVVLSRHAKELEAALPDVPRLRVTGSAEELQIDGPVLAVLGERVALPPETFAWYVGPGEAREPFHACRREGSDATNEILALFGTALVQERAARPVGTPGRSPRSGPRSTPCVWCSDATLVAWGPITLSEPHCRTGRTVICALSWSTGGRRRSPSRSTGRRGSRAGRRHLPGRRPR